METISREEAIRELAKRELAKRASVAGDVPAIAAEFASGFMADAPKNMMKNPIRAAVSGPVGVQFAEGANLPTSISNLFSRKKKELAYKDEENSIPFPEAKTGVGKAAGVVANIAGGLLGGPRKAVQAGVEGAYDLARSSASGGRKVKQIQKGFFPFQKKATKAFGDVIKEGVDKGASNNYIPANEAEAIFSPINQATEETGKFLTTKMKNAASYDDALDLKGLLRKKAQLRRTLSVPERNGRIVTERSRAVKDTIKNIDSTLSNRVDGMSGAKKAYSMFYRAKELLEKFEPQFAGLPAPFGTMKGEKLLRKIGEFSEEEIHLLRMFENSEKIKVVDPARMAETAAKMRNLVVKIAGIGLTLGAVDAIGGGKLIKEALDFSN